MNVRNFLRVAGAMAVAIGMAACENDPAASGTARVSVHLTDAPGDLASAEVEVREIYLQGGPGDADGEGRVELFTGSRVFDLLELQNGVTAELAEVTIPAGTYSQLRLVIGEATLTTEGGATYSTTDGTLMCPSCAQTGLKVNLAGGAVELSGEQDLVVDFDVAQSFGRQAGRSGLWVMHPVIAATTAESSATIEGSVVLATDLVLPTCGGAAAAVTNFVPIFSAGELSLSSQTDAEGEFRSTFVSPGTYTVGFDSDVSFDNGDVLVYTASSDATTVTVAAGETATVNYTVLTATCTAVD
ncbi:MAG: DUF4382 domain-containing protein [Gemmatimonadota bacterium]